MTNTITNTTNTPSSQGRERREADEEFEAMRDAWRSVERRWALSALERGMLLPDGGATAVQPPHGTERRMRLLVEVDRHLRFDDDVLRAWLRAAAADLDGVSPLEVLAGPDLGRVRRLLEAGASS